MPTSSANKHPPSHRHSTRSGTRMQHGGDASGDDSTDDPSATKQPPPPAAPDPNVNAWNKVTATDRHSSPLRPPPHPSLGGDVAHGNIFDILASSESPNTTPPDGFTNASAGRSTTAKTAGVAVAHAAIDNTVPPATSTTLADDATTTASSTARPSSLPRPSPNTSRLQEQLDSMNAAIENSATQIENTDTQLQMLQSGMQLLQESLRTQKELANTLATEFPTNLQNLDHRVTTFNDTVSNKIDTLATTIDEKFANAESSLATTVESRLFERTRALIDDRLAATTAAPSADTAPDMNDDDVSAALDRASAALDLELAPRSRLSIDPPGTPVDALPPTRRNTTAGISSDDASRGGIESDSDGDDTNADRKSVV